MRFKGALLGDSCALRGIRGGGDAKIRVGKSIRTILDIRRTWLTSRLLVYFQVTLLAARCWRRQPVEDKNQRFVVGPQLEGSALEVGAEVFYT